MKLRYWILIAVAALIAIIAGSVVVLLETEAGLQWTAGIAVRHSQGALTIGTVRGKLAGPLELDHVRLALSGAVIEAQKLELDWSPGALVSGTLHVAHLRGRGVRITTRPSEGPSRGLPERIKLPVHVIVGEADFADLVLKTPARTLQLNRLGFALDASSERVQLERLDAQGPELALSGNVEVEPHDDWRIRAAFAGIVRPPNYPPATGKLRVDGALRGELKLEQSLSAPVHEQLSATVASLFDKPQVRGRVRVAPFDPHTLDAKWPELEAGADLAFGGTLERFRVHGRIDVTAAVAYPVNLDLAAGLDGRRLRIDDLALALAGRPARVTLHGVVDAGETPNADLALAWKHIAWPFAGTKPEASAAAGEAHVKGSLDDWTLKGKTLLRIRDLPRGSWTFAANGDRRTIVLSRLDGDWLGGTLTAQGTVGLADTRPFSLTASVRGVHTQAIAKKLNGNVGFDLAANGELEPLQARARVTNLAGRVQGHSVTGGADLAWADGTLDAHALSLVVGANRFTAEGRWGRRINLAWRLQAPRLAELGFGLAGRLDARGRLSGPADAPRLEVNLDGEQLRWNEIGVQKIRAQTDFDFATRTPTALNLQVEDFERGDLVVQRLEATLSGPPAAQRFRLALSSTQGDLMLAGKGALARGSWSGTLTEGSLNPARGPRFDLGAPASLTFARARLQLGKSCWSGPQEAAFCLAAASGPKGWKLALDLESLPLALADTWLTGGPALSGELNGTLTAAGGGGKLNAQLALRADGASVSRNFAGQERRLTFRKAALDARLDSANVTATLDLALADGGVLNLTADMPWRAHAEPTGRLHLVAHLPDLSGAGALSDAVSGVAGRADADLALRGSLAAPRFEGELRLSGLAATLTRFGTRVQDGNIVVSGAGEALRIVGSLEDGHGGRLSLHGNLAREAQEWTLAARVQGRDFRAVDMPEMRVAVSPDFNLDVKGRAIALTGSVVVPSAQIAPPQFANAIAPTPDLVIIGEEQNAGPPPWRLSARLNLRLGEDVRFNGYGLSARIGGEITLNERPEQLTTASGELKILDGRYKAYGQDLKIERGRLLFSGGPIANPGLDIRAVRRIGTVTAGLRVNGTLRNPSLRVFSSPPMSQTDALAYLLFGHAVQQNNRSQNNTLNQAANAIGLAGGTWIAKSVGKHVGLDSVTVENASEFDTRSNQASLFLGKYLSPRLYVSYGIGLYAPINLFRLRYTLSRRWALEAESGSISGADILFSIER